MHGKPPAVRVQGVWNTKPTQSQEAEFKDRMNANTTYVKMRRQEGEQSNMALAHLESSGHLQISNVQQLSDLPPKVAENEGIIEENYQIALKGLDDVEDADNYVQENADNKTTIFLCIEDKKIMSKVLADIIAIGGGRPSLGVKQPFQDCFGIDQINRQRGKNPEAMVLMKHEEEYVRIDVFNAENVAVHILALIKDRIENTPEILDKINKMKFQDIDYTLVTGPGLESMTDAHALAIARGIIKEKSGVEENGNPPEITLKKRSEKEIKFKVRVERNAKVLVPKRMQKMILFNQSIVAVALEDAQYQEERAAKRKEELIKSLHASRSPIVADEAGSTPALATDDREGGSKRPHGETSPIASPSSKKKMAVTASL